MNDTIQNIMDNIDKKNVQSLCKKIIKKCNLKSTKDIENIKELALWLYIYNHKEEAITLCDFIQEIEFNGNYTYWDNIDTLYCLKSRILREQGLFTDAKNIIEFVNLYREPLLYKNLIEWFTKTLDLNIEKALIESKSSARKWRLVKLEAAIGYREAGKFPLSDSELEKIITEQIDILSLEK